MLKAREAVLQLKAYRPPLGGREGLRLDFNENTSGASPRVVERLRQMTAADLAMYPEREPVERVLAEYLGVAPSQVLLTNGVDEALHLAAETYLGPGDEVLFAEPTFAMYELYGRATGAVTIAIRAADDFRFPTEDLVTRITSRTRMVCIANPNNPTGAAVAKADLLRIAALAPDAAVVIDEAYFDFHGESVLAEIGRLPNLLVTRTFSKAYGLAGLRVGVLVGAEEQIAAVRRVASPYNVNAVALACLPAALADGDYVNACVRQVEEGRVALQRQLADAGVPFWPSRANFVLCRIGAKRSGFLAAMQRRGILVRDRHGDPRCDGCVRISLGDAAANARLLAALPRALLDIGWTPADRRWREVCA